MRQKTGERIPVTYEEFTFLAAWSNLQNYRELDLNFDGMSEERVPELLYDLVRKKAVESNGEQFRICQPYKEMLRYLAFTDSVWKLQDDREKLPVVYLYEGEQTMVFGTSANRKDTLLFEFVDREDVISYLEELTYLPEKPEFPERAETWMFEENGRRLCTFQLAKASPGEEVLKKLQILEFPQGYVLEFAQGGESRRFLYTVEQLEQLMKGEKSDDSSGYLYCGNGDEA